MAAATDSQTKWYTLTAEAAAKQLQVDPAKGLSTAEAQQRLQQYGANELAAKKKESPLHAFLRQYQDFMQILLLGAAVVNILVTGEWATTIVLLLLTVFNAGLALRGEAKAAASLEALQNTMKDTTRVRRDGDAAEIDAGQVVPGDIVLLQAGDRVPADGRLIQAATLEIEESALTGESVASPKNTDVIDNPDAPLGDRHDMAYMNTGVTRGSAEMIVTTTGMGTQMGSIATLLNKTESDKTPLQKQLDKLTKIIAGVAGIAFVIMIILGIMNGQSLDTVFVAGIALAIAAIPTGLPAVVTTMYSMGARVLAGEELQPILDSSSLPPLRTIVSLLFAEFDELPKDLILVLDDYGVIHDEGIHEFLSELLNYPHPKFSLVLLTRHDPPLPLPNWRVRHQIIEIRSADLRFSLPETTRFLQQLAGNQLDDKMIALLNEKTEGWPAGLRLAALSFSHRESVQDYIDALSGSNVYIMDYLFSEVFCNMPPEMRPYLIQSSILDRFSASLCQTILPIEDTDNDMQSILHQLVASNVFIVALDNQRQWFRYHHLFREFLQTHLRQNYSTAFVAALHGRAGAWYAAHGYVEEALKHTLAARDMETAVQLVAAKRHTLINQEDYRRLSRWLQMFPQEVVEGSPDLLLIQARFAQTIRGDLAELLQILGKVDALLAHLDLEPRQAALLDAESNALRAVALYNVDPEPQAALAVCRDALSVLPKNWYVIRSYCWMIGAVELQALGDLKAAYEWIERGRREDLHGDARPRARNAAAEGFVSWIAGNLTGLQQVGEFMVRVTSGSSDWESQGWGNHFLAMAHYHQNDLQRAQRHAQETFKHRYYNPSTNVQNFFLLTMILQAQGKPDEAQEMLQTALEFAVEYHSAASVFLVQFFQAELAVRQGRALEHILWAEQAYAQLQFGPSYRFYTPQLTIPKVLLAAGTADGRALAADCLQRLHAFATSTHHVRILIEVLALEAQLHAANNDEEAAFAALEESLALAQPGGFIRLYIDLGPEIVALLRRMHDREPYSAYITAILSAFVEPSKAELQSDGNGKFVEPFTRREAEIIELLAKRYSNKEISAELVISPETVKRHAINIYQKLNVHNRREAVETAVALGLIPLR